MFVLGESYLWFFNWLLTSCYVHRLFTLRFYSITSFWQISSSFHKTLTALIFCCNHWSAVKAKQNFLLLISSSMGIGQHLWYGINSSCRSCVTARIADYWCQAPKVKSPLRGSFSPERLWLNIFGILDCEWMIKTSPY